MSLTIRIADKCSQKKVFYRLLQMNLIRCYKSKRKIPCCRPWREAALVMRDDAILCYLDPSIFQPLFLWLGHRGIAYLSLSQPMAGIGSHSHSHEVKSNWTIHLSPKCMSLDHKKQPDSPHGHRGNVLTPHRSTPGDSNLEEFNITLYYDFTIKVKAKTQTFI